MRRTVVALIVVMTLTAPAVARLHRAWSYEDLAKAATLVVIARPVVTTATGRRETLPNISNVDPAGKVSPVQAERVETELEVVVVLEGTPRNAAGKSTRRIVLHHHRELPGSTAKNGPGLVSFDPKAPTQYLMFLVREPDGRYAAVSGFTDPDQAIEPLRRGAP